MTDPLRDRISIEQAAARLGISPRGARRAAERNLGPDAKVDGRWALLPEHVDRLLGRRGRGRPAADGDLSPARQAEIGADVLTAVRDLEGVPTLDPGDAEPAALAELFRRVRSIVGR